MKKIAILFLIVFITYSCSSKNENSDKTQTGTIKTETQTGNVNSNKPEIDLKEDKLAQEFIKNHFEDINNGEFEKAYNHFSKKFLVNYKVKLKNGPYASLENYKKAYSEWSKTTILDIKANDNLDYSLKVKLDNKNSGKSQELFVNIKLLNNNGTFNIATIGVHGSDLPKK